jgi:hypothetical protein
MLSPLTNHHARTRYDAQGDHPAAPGPAKAGPGAPIKDRRGKGGTFAPQAQQTDDALQERARGFPSRIRDRACHNLRLSRLQAGRFLEELALVAIPTGEAARLREGSKTFEQTRSGTGHTPALGQDLPRIRTLDECLSRCPQARLRTLPDLLGERGKEGLHVEIGRQKRGVQVALHRGWKPSR